MRRIAAMLGAGIFAGVGLVAFGVFVLPYISLWLIFGWFIWI